jgi:hypothetical protein
MPMKLDQSVSQSVSQDDRPSAYPHLRWEMAKKYHGYIIPPILVHMNVHTTQGEGQAIPTQPGATWGAKVANFRGTFSQSSVDQMQLFRSLTTVQSAHLDACEVGAVQRDAQMRGENVRRPLLP